MSLLVTAAVNAQTNTFFYYNEVARDGRIYVFADPDYETQGEGAFSAEGAIERPGYGPNGETVVFYGQNAVNLYNFKHGLPSEAPPPAEKPKPKYPSTKISGLMFGDYYYYYQRHICCVSESNPTQVDGQSGLWMRRIYLTYDYTYSEDLTTRFRLEANSNGKFAGGNLTPYVKDAYLRWTFAGQQDLTLGIQPTVAFDWFETALWGLRHIEKTPVDLYKLDSSRDFGLTFDGPLPIDGLSYALQWGNESGNGSETDEGKILRLEVRYDQGRGLAVEGFYSHSNKPGEHHQTAQGIVGFRGDAFRIAAQYVWQEQQSGEAGVPNQTINVWSGFAVWDFLPKKADVFLRADHVAGSKGGGQSTGLPGADGIDYLLLSPAAPFNFFLVGGEWFLNKKVRLSPNLEIIRYTRDPDPVNYPGRRQDSIARLTFFWTF